MMPDLTLDSPRPVLSEHPLRLALAGEIHARPFESLPAPVRVSQVAMFHAGLEATAERAFLTAFLSAHAAPPPSPEAQHLVRSLGQVRFKWERHSEFSTYTFMAFNASGEPFVDTALALVAAAWQRRFPGQMMNATHVEVFLADTATLATWFGEAPQVGSRVLGGAGEVWTDFRLHADGFGRILVCDRGLTPGQTGRLVQRLLEIETYRMMALLGFPVARQVSREIGRMDQGLTDIISALADPGLGGKDRDLLERLTTLAAEAERLDAGTSFRLSAARAYHAIVTQRIGELREERMQGVQTIAEFMGRRLTPAMKTCDSAVERQQLLARRAARAGDLLRTRVDIALEEKNRDLLHSMDQRAKVQLRMQEAVEGLSVAAISYYALGLVLYAAKGLKGAGLAVDPDVAAMIALPVIVIGVIVGLRRLRKVLGHEEN